VNDFPEFKIVPYNDELLDDLLYLLTRCFQRQNFTPERVDKFFKKGYGHKNYTFLAYWQDKAIGHYSLITFPLYYKGKSIKGGSPEFECIDRDFIVKCVREGIDYRKLNPILRLHEEVEKAAKKEGIALLYHFFPSESSVASLRKTAYKNIELEIRYYFWPEKPGQVTSRHFVYRPGFFQKLLTRLRNLSGTLFMQRHEFVSDNETALRIIERNWIENRDKNGISFEQSANFLKNLFSSEEYLKLVVTDSAGNNRGSLVALKEGRIARVLLWSLPVTLKGPVFRSLAHHLREDRSFLPEGFDHIEILDIEGHGDLKMSSMLLNGFVCTARKEHFSYWFDEKSFQDRKFDPGRDIVLSILFSNRIFS
jgi:hypothetical protein